MGIWSSARKLDIAVLGHQLRFTNSCIQRPKQLISSQQCLTYSRLTAVLQLRSTKNICRFYCTRSTDNHYGAKGVVQTNSDEDQEEKEGEMETTEMETHSESSRSKRKNIAMKNTIKNFLINHKLSFELGHTHFIANCHAAQSNPQTGKKNLYINFNTGIFNFYELKIFL